MSFFALNSSCSNPCDSFSISKIFKQTKLMKTKSLSRNTSYIVVFLFLFTLMGCINSNKKQTSEIRETQTEVELKPFFKLSLAQWSLHNFVREEHGDPFQFASMANEMGFEGLEYVSQLYTDKIELLGLDKVIDSLKFPLTIQCVSSLNNA